MQGISTRQYYKAMALNALISNKQDEVDLGSINYKDLVAEAALYAEMMLEEDGLQTD